MVDRWFVGVAHIVRTRRPAVLWTVTVLTLASLFGLTRLEADPSPRALLASADPEQEQVAAAFRKDFGSTDNVVAVLISSDRGVYTPEALGYVNQLSEAIQKLPHVERVDSLTRMPFRRAQPADDEELTLDSLDEAAADPMADDPRLLGALSDIVAAAPELFPLGLASLSEKMGTTKFERIITTDTPSAAQVDELKAAVRALPVIEGKLVSRSGRHALIATSLTDDLATHRDLERAVVGVEDLLARVRPPEGVRAVLSGLPVVRTTMVSHMRRDQAVLTPGTMVVSLFLLMLAFRWWVGVVMPLAKVGLTALWVLGSMALFGIKLNVVTNILPALLITIGLSDSIHFVHRYIEEYAHTRDPRTAMGATVRTMARACLGTSATTAAGLFSLYTCKTRMLAEFGMVGGFGVLVGYLTTIFLLPALMLGLSPPRDATTSSAPVSEPRSEARSDTPKDRLSPLDRFVIGVTRGILRAPGLVLLGALSLTAFAYYLGQDVRVDSALLDQFEPDDPIFVTTKILEDDFEGVRPLEVSLRSHRPGRFLEPDVLRKLERVSRWIEKRPSVISAMTAADQFEQAFSAFTGRPASPDDALRTREELAGLAYVFKQRKPNPLAGFLSNDAAHARLRVRLKDAGSKATLELVAALDAELRKELGDLPDVRWGFTGDAFASSQGLAAVVSDLTGSLVTAVLVIFVVIVLVLRSVRYGLLAIPPNLVPLALALWWMTVRDIPLNAATAIIFSVSIGMTVDGSIHMLTRLQEELAQGAGIDEALMRTARGSGTALTIACASLVLGFSVLLLSSFVPVQRFAELIALSIAACLVATLVVLPATVQTVGKKVFSPAPK